MHETLIESEVEFFLDSKIGARSIGFVLDANNGFVGSKIGWFVTDWKELETPEILETPARDWNEFWCCSGLERMV